MSLNFTTPRTRIRLARFYRSTPGDLSWKEIPFLGRSDEEAEAHLGKALLDRFNDPKRREKPPLIADLLEEDGSVSLTLDILDSSRVRRR